MHDLGAAAFFHASQAEADRALELVLEHGINHIDTAASYGDSELRLAPWLREHRGGVFLAVDVIEWEQALREGGALEAALEAREEGLVRFIGVTGHGRTVARMHRLSLERFPFDSVLAPYSWSQMQDEVYAADFAALDAMCSARGVALQTIKAIALRRWDGREQTAGTWYEPLTEQADIDLAVHWVLGNPHVFLNTVGDTALLPKALDAAERFVSRPPDEQLAALGTTTLFA